jgi:hypothetical protein
MGPLDSRTCTAPPLIPGASPWCSDTQVDPFEEKAKCETVFFTLYGFNCCNQLVQAIETCTGAPTVDFDVVVFAFLVVVAEV